MWGVVAALLTTSIGIVVVVLKDSGRLETGRRQTVGQLSLLGALLGDVASVALLVPLLLAAMILTRTLPSLLFLRLLTPREVAASALLMSTKPTFVVAAVQIGPARGGLQPATATALITTAIITVLLLPATASWALR